VVLANLNGNTPQEIRTQLAAIALGDKIVLPGERKEVKVDPKLFDSYVGHFQLTPTLTFAISRAGDHLSTQLPDSRMSTFFRRATETSLQESSTPRSLCHG
jgi:hypothetical protein